MKAMIALVVIPLLSGCVLANNPLPPPSHEIPPGEPQSHVPVSDARLTIDSVVQSKQPQGPHHKRSLLLDVLVRNTGDKPAVISDITLRFDERQRPVRASSNIQRVSGVYVSTVGREKAATNVEPNYIGQASAWYPRPGANSLVINTPVTQTINARSAERLRLEIDFLDGAIIRGPINTVRVEINYNNHQTVRSETIKLSR